jgi:hypothetical protein
VARTWPAHTAPEAAVTICERAPLTWLDMPAASIAAKVIPRMFRIMVSGEGSDRALIDHCTCRAEDSVWHGSSHQPGFDPVGQRLKHLVVEEQDVVMQFPEPGLGVQRVHRVKSGCVL